MEEFAKGNIVETFEKSWEIQQEALKGETAKILSVDQMAAFQDYQKQAKEMQLMGLKMAEKMMSKEMPMLDGILAKPETKVDFKRCQGGNRWVSEPITSMAFNGRSRRSFSNRLSSTAFQLTLGFANDSLGIRELDLDGDRPKDRKEVMD